ncbi:MAG: tRNA threonylcarbamoyladenosine dehydratase [Runella slithyformis]|nr:MAG: tRNA threonylcarbamoyladenosine dehydratase [Runella slithyformis]
MPDLTWLSRTKLLVGDDGLSKLQNAHVLVVGLGGVGSFAAEFVARAGVGRMTIVDGDVVDPSNRNRQLPALASTHGQSKAALMAERLLDINPELNLTVVREFLTPEKVTEILESSQFDYVMDCIDSVMPKITLLNTAFEKGYRLVSSMGAGGKYDPTQIKVADLFDTYECLFAQYVRKRLKRYGNRTGIKAVFSTEPVQRDSLMLTDGSNFKRSAYGTISYIPAAFGGVCASVVIRELLGQNVVLNKSPAKEKQAKRDKKTLKTATNASNKRPI